MGEKSARNFNLDRSGAEFDYTLSIQGVKIWN